MSLHPATPYLIGWGLAGFLLGMLLMWAIFKFALRD